jgi:hypothetical protein
MKNQRVSLVSRLKAKIDRIALKPVNTVDIFIFPGKHGKMYPIKPSVYTMMPSIYLIGDSLEHHACRWGRF